MEQATTHAGAAVSPRREFIEGFQHSKWSIGVEKLARALSQIRWAARYEGWPFALFRILVKTSAFLGTGGTSRGWFQGLAERRFDRRFNVQTAGTVRVEELDISGPRQAQAVEYWPTSSHRFGSVIDDLAIDYHDCVFIDFGSGKGRALLMASEFPFKRIIGIELSQKFHDIAEKNIRQFRSPRQQCTDIQCLCEDATSFEFPPERLVVYLYNPFSAPVLTSVIDNLRESLAQTPRPVILVYFNPEQRQVIEESGIFTPPDLQGEGSSSWAVYRLREKDR